MSDSFNSDLVIARAGGHKKEFVLPDYKTIKQGYIRELADFTDNLQVVKMTNERFMIPEVLFAPSDIGIN